MNRQDLNQITIQVVSLAFVIRTFGTAGVQTLAPLAPFLQESWTLSNTQIGILSAVMFFGSTIMSIPMGWLVDAYGSRYMTVLGMGLLGLSLLCSASAPSFGFLLVFLFFTGVAFGAIGPVTNKMLMEWVPRRIRATMMSLKQMGSTAGMALTALVVPWIAVQAGWSWGFLSVGIVSLVLAGLGLLYHENPHDDEDSGTSSRVQDTNSEESLWSRVKTSVLTILRNDEIMFMSLLGSIFSITQVAFASYLVLYLHNDLQYPETLAGFLLALSMIGGGLGRPFWGWISDRLQVQRRRQIVYIIGLLIMSFGLIFTWSAHLVPLWLMCVLVLLIGATAAGWHGIYVTAISEAAGTRSTGLASGVSMAVLRTGVIVGPPIFGILADFGGYTTAWTLVFLVPLIGGGFMYLLEERGFMAPEPVATGSGSSQ